MKYLLLPFTILIYYLIAFYCIYLSTLLFSFLFNVNTIFLIYGYTFILGFIFLMSTFPYYFFVGIIKFYRLNWVLTILHLIAGSIGFFNAIYYFVNNPLLIMINGENIHFLKGMWIIAPIKSIVLIIPFACLYLSYLFSLIIVPLKTQLNEEEY
jgi:hypothetical protein